MYKMYDSAVSRFLFDKYISQTTHCRQKLSFKNVLFCVSVINWHDQTFLFKKTSAFNEMYSYVRFYGTRLLGTSGYKELIFISPIFTKELVPYTFIRKSGYKEQYS